MNKGTKTSSKTPDSGLQEALASEEGVGEVLVSGEQISKRVAEIGRQITQDYQGRAPLLVVILKGAVLFASDLCRSIDLPVEMDFMAVSSYGNGTSSSGVVRILKDLDIDISDRDVILVEDIVDSGLTLQYLRKSLNARGPASLAICSLLLRETIEPNAAAGKGEAHPPHIDYLGFVLPRVWVIGYGLDLAQRFRNLPDIRAFETDH